MQKDLSCPATWRRSLRASQERRLERATRERRLRRARRQWRERIARRGAVVTVCVLTVMSGAAFAHERASSERPAAVRGSSVRAVQEALGITADGIYGPRTRRAVRAFQRRKGLSVDGIVGPQTRRALGLRGGGSSGGEAVSGREGNSVTSKLKAIARCESGGNPRAVSSNGRYRGKYQFTRATWRRMGGRGDPAKASEAEQDRRAAKLYALRGSSPWPSCG
ncbi:MAG TPA: transglycosylase family protein [Solirubrobacteraceae bacterium]|nr:transglycosylase family protein [Solirubrobacteraceae bacterium]